MQFIWFWQNKSLFSAAHDWYFGNLLWTCQPTGGERQSQRHVSSNQVVQCDFDVKSFLDLHLNDLFNSLNTCTIVSTLYMTSWEFLTQKTTQLLLFLHMWLWSEWLPSKSLNSHYAICWRKPPFHGYPSLQFTYNSNNLLFHIFIKHLWHKKCHEAWTLPSLHVPVRRFNRNSIHSLEWCTELQIWSTCTLLEHCISISCHFIRLLLHNMSKGNTG